MNLLLGLLNRRRMVLTAAGLLALTGFMAWSTMARQEDPPMPDFWGQVTTVFPGASAETVERLLLDPLEEALAEVDELKRIESTARSEIAILELDLVDDVADPAAAWDEVRRAVADARAEFPDGALEPMVRDDLSEVESIVLAITGGADAVALALAAEELKDDLLTLRTVSRVEIVGDPEEQVTVELDDATARRLGLEPAGLAGQLSARNQILPGGTLRMGGKRVTLQPDSEFDSVEEIATTPILLPSGAAIPLGEIARVRRGPVEPLQSLMRFNGELAVGVSIVPRAGINVIDFGEEVRNLVERSRASFEPLTIHEAVFQPARVERRIAGLGGSLLISVFIVAGVLLLFMGPRLGLVVTSVVPLVVFSSVGLYALGGGLLQQMSIAALVVALGMLVDNAIVVAENVQDRIDRGEPASVAAQAAVRALAIPLAGATGTTLAAFIPLLTAEGVTAIFTRAIPVVVMLTLTMSYLYAVFVTPILSHVFLRRRQRAGGDFMRRLGSKIGSVSVRRPLPVLLAAMIVVVASGWGAGFVGQQFFPSSDRNQVMIDTVLPEGAHLDDTDRVARRLEVALLEHPEVVSVAAYVGRSSPHFYYNLQLVPFSPQSAQLAVETSSKATVGELMDWTRQFARQHMPEAEVTARRLEQGPPIKAPIEVRLFADDLGALDEARSLTAATLRKIEGAIDVRDDLGVGAPSIRFAIDDAAAGRRGLDRTDVALSIFGRTRGLPAGELRTGDDPVPIVVRSSMGERLRSDDLTGLDVSAPGVDPVPLAQVASFGLEWRPAAIYHRNGKRVVTVTSQLADGATFSGVQAALGPRLDEIAWPPGVTWAFGGEAEESGEANSAIARMLPLGLLLLIGILLAEFNSFRRVAIVLVTVPLAAVGVVPGLLISGQPFGFTSVLGVVALVGIVVNNAIVLLDVVERRRSEGVTIAEALRSAVERRTRPILLTTATTVAGLLPLAFSSSSLWPPMASAMISGLIASTFLTLLVIPALYRLLFEPRQLVSRPAKDSPRGRVAEAALSIIVLGISTGLMVSPAPAIAQEVGGETSQIVAPPKRISLDQAMELALQRPGARSAFSQAVAAGYEARAVGLEGWLPRVDISAGWVLRDRDLGLPTPFGDIVFGERDNQLLSLTLRQPLIDIRQRSYVAPAARADAEAVANDARRIGEQAVAFAGSIFLDLLAVDARMNTIDQTLTSLSAELADTEERIAAGRSLNADGLKIQLAIDQARQDRVALVELRRVLDTRMARAIGSEEIVEIAGDSLPILPQAPAFDELVERGLEHRADYLAVESRVQAAELSEKGVRAESWPTVDAQATWSRDTGSPFEPQDVIEGRVALVWTPFDRGTRKPRRVAAEQRRESLEQRLLEGRRIVQVDVRRALASLATAESAKTTAESGIEAATESLRVERERLRAGRSTTVDLLLAETALAEQRTRFELSKIDRVRAWVELGLAVGEPDLLFRLGVEEQGESDDARGASQPSARSAMTEWSPSSTIERGDIR